MVICFSYVLHDTYSRNKNLHCVFVIQDTAENSNASIYAPERNAIEISIPSYVQRGSGFDIHFEYEVKVTCAKHM